MNAISRRISQTLRPVVDGMMQRFTDLPAKDRTALGILGLIVLVLFFWGAIWNPLQTWVDSGESRLASAKDTRLFLASNYGRIQSLTKGSASGTDLKKDLSAVILSSGRRAGLTFARVQPARQGVSVWVDEVPYKNFLGWIIDLHNNEHLDVRQARVERTSTDGFVKAFLRFSR